MSKDIKLAPSILSADFTNLGAQAREVEQADADLIHIDVMDGHFVPNITVGPVVVSAVRKCTKLPLSVHLMIEQPELYIEDFIAAGADMLSVHLEACRHLFRAIKRIKSHSGIKAGVAINPATAVGNLINILDEIDFALIMSVDPGFGGQEFIPQTIDKIKFLRNKIDEQGLTLDIEVDGGVTPAKISDIVSAGANIIVAGSAIFKQKSIPSAIKDFRQAISS